MQHAWLQGSCPNDEVRPSEKARIGRNFWYFQKSSQFQSSVICLLVGFIMDKAEAHRLRKQFQAIDLNQDGLITLDEMQEFSNGVLEDQFRTLLGRNVNWRELFSILDHDNDGQISYREFVAGAADKSNLLSAESLRKAFDALDINADGLITQDDINKRLENKAAADIEAY